ncbi:hypothetical protein D915_008008 [Fasciola hepatica]|uniref:Uncharacterized protein n=1 Tax=Fasciola hepatica TaxID=6192 RepID=A0A4E0R4H9_FASHE|nr:hypothetical protein D915_008008 [Fasciola hepatica]
MPPGCRLSSTVSSFELLSREFFYPGYLHMKALNYALTCTHDLFQMPWSWTIVGTAFLIRTLVNSPFYFYSEKNLAKVLHISLDCARTSPMLLKKLESSASYKQLDPSAAQKYFKKMNRRVFLKTCEGWNYVVPGMITEGLTVACTNAVLPVMVLLAGLANVELVYLRQLRSPESITDPNRYSDPFGYKLGRGVGWFVNGLVFSAAVFLPKVEKENSVGSYIFPTFN